jgi:hypothetical protein
MKKILRVGILLLGAALLVIIAVDARAEHVFTRDGRILEGAIAGENDAAITLVLKDKSRRTIARKDILRMLYSEDYKTKLVIRLTNGDEFEGFIVDESREEYTIRKKLNDTDEQSISKERITYTAKKRPTELVARPAQNGVELTWSKPLGSFKKFIIYVKKKGEEYRAVDDTIRTSLKVKGLDPDTLYYFTVRLLDDANYESPPSNEASVKTLKAGDKEPEQAPKEKAEKEKRKEKEKIAEKQEKAKTRTGEDASNVGISVRPAAIVPILDFSKSASVGAGGIAGIDWLHVGGSGFKMGLHGGAWYMFPSGGTTSHIVAPLTLGLGYEFAPAAWCRLAPVLDGGYAYSAMTYSYYNTMSSMVFGMPVKSKKSASAFSPIGMAGVELLFLPTDLVGIGLDARYGLIFEKSGLLHFISLTADVMFRF